MKSVCHPSSASLGIFLPVIGYYWYIIEVGVNFVWPVGDLSVTVRNKFRILKENEFQTDRHLLMQEVKGSINIVFLLNFASP